MQHGKKGPGLWIKNFERRAMRLHVALLKEIAAQVLGKRAPRSKVEFVAKTRDRLKEAGETAYWVKLLNDENIVRGRVWSACFAKEMN